jgi:hypothetical protein
MKINRVLFILVAFAATFLSAESVTENSIPVFRDTTDTTRQLVWQEDPNYPFLTPIEKRWIIMAYLSDDNIINPLSKKGKPTGDDIVNTYVTGKPGHMPGQVASGLRFGPDVAGAPLIVGAAGIAPEYRGKYVYFRVFNAPRIEDATKYMVFKKPFKVTEAGPLMVDLYPDYAWDTKPVWKWIKAQKNKCH